MHKLNKLSDNQGVFSPWRSANPRKPLEKFRSPSKEGGQDVSSPNSPPNSNHKESTKLGVSQLNMSEVSASSPALVRSEDILSERKNGSFNRMKEFNSSRNKYTRKRGSRVKMSDSQSEDDQPSGSCQFVGDKSTINNSRLRRRGSGDKSSDNSLPASTIDSDLYHNANPPQQRQPALGSWISTCHSIVILLVFTPIFVPYLVYQEVTTGTNWLEQDLEGTRPPINLRDSAEFYKLTRKNLNMIKTRFPTQSETTWKTIDTTLSSAMYPLPDHPVVLLLVSPPSATPTARCLASQLIEISANALNPWPAPPPSQMMISAEFFRFNPFDNIIEKLHLYLSHWGVVGINQLEKLPSHNAYTLQIFVDNLDFQYNHAVVMVLTLELKEDDEAQDDYCNIEAKVEKQLFEVWREELGLDKFSALISRVVVSVASVRPESGVVC